MSILRRILGRQPAAAVVVPPPPPAPPPLPPLRGDLLTLAGPGLAGTDLSGDLELTITVGGRTYTAATTPRGPGEFELHDFREIVEAPAPEPVAAEPEPVAAEPESEPVAPDPEPVAAEPEPVAAEPEPEPPAAAELAPPPPPAFVAAVEEAPAVAEESPAVAVAEAPVIAVDEPEADPAEIAVVRLPLTDPSSAVVGYELVVDAGATAGARATAALLLDAFGDVGLERLAGRHPAWIPMTAEFLLEVGTPPVRPDRVVLQVPAAPPTEPVLAALRRLHFSGYTIALDGYDAQLAEVARYVRIPVAGRTDEELRAAIAEPAGRNLELVATGVVTPEELARCRALGFTVFQGEFFGRPDPTRQRRVGTGGVASLAALAEVAKPDASFEDLERAIGNDVGLSLKLLRYINSAFFSLPRNVETVREALTLLGTATVRRWATVMALVSASDAPEELVELALQRARMCEVLGGNRAVDASDGHFTVGLFSVADSLLGVSMQDVLETLPFSEEIRAALLRREGPKGELLTTVMAYEQGDFAAADDAGVSPARAYGDAVAYAGVAVRSA